MFQLIQFVADIAGADDRPDGRARDDIGMNVMGRQFRQDADMGPAARGSRAQRDADDRSPRICRMFALAMTSWGSPRFAIPKLGEWFRFTWNESATRL
jgi:hypothetical protein